MPPDQEQIKPTLTTSLQIVNQLILKTSSISNREALIFHIVNDSHHLIPYDRAYLFSFDPKKRELIGASGETAINTNSPLVTLLNETVSAIKSPDSAASLTKEHFIESKGQLWEKLQQETARTVLWIPIFFDQKQILGLWLEQWNTSTFLVPISATIALMKESLATAYGIAWSRITHKKSLKKWLGLSWKKAAFATAILLACSLLIRIPLRVAAPCEVVPKDPYLIRAPLEGVVDQLLVDPGQEVDIGTPLLEYDKKVILQALKSAEKDLLAKEFELKRTMVQGLKDSEVLNELALRTIEKQKALIKLNFNQYQASLLSVDAPQKGVIYLENPDIWRGKPVSVGEKILEISNPKETSVKIWIPEKDNIAFDTKKSVIIFLNSTPMTTYKAKIEYIGNETVPGENQIPSYLAKANWIGSPPQNVNIGVKGTAVLYGEPVTLFYYLFRKPWYTLRNFFAL